MLRLRVVLAIALCVPMWARKPGEAIKPGFNLFSKQQDIELGAQMSSQIRRQQPIVDNRDLQDYITRIGRKLAEQPEADKYPYTFTLVQEKSINAFALPGGPTFIHTGLILAADNEAQVAGVIAHEIAHVALRHGTNQASKANLMQLPALLAGIATGSNLLAQLTQLGAVGFMLRFSRTAETQADIVGARMMSKAGYNPIEMARFFEKLEAEGSSRAPEFLSDHPNPGNRVRNVEEEIRGMPRRYYDASAGDFVRIKQLAASAAGTRAGGGVSPDGVVRGGALPAIPEAGGFRQLKGREFALSYPDNWEVHGDRESAMITIAPRAGIVEGRGGNAVGYGAIVSYYFPDRRARDLGAATDALIRHLHSLNPSMQVTSRERRRLRVDGSSAMLTQLASDSPFAGHAETDLLVTVERPQGLFYVVFIAPQRDFRRFEGAFDEMTRSIRFSN
ncbi:MAG: M48 family metalloprotease [Bryobacteraceae bacterium]